MKRVTIALLIAGTFLPFLGGCIYVRPKAKTVLAHSAMLGEESRLIGFKEVYWREESDEIELLGFGVHPREHETYAFIINEPFPAASPRWIHVIGSDGNYRISLVLNNARFTGTLKRIDRKRDKLKFNTSDVTWDGGRESNISGQVIAKRVASAENFDFMRASYRRDRAGRSRR